MPQRRILIVEDDESIRAAVAYCLRTSGYTAELATNSRDALARAQEKDVSLLILEPAPPHVSGCGLLEHLQAGRKDNLLPAIILTTFEDEGYRQRCFELGARHFIVQPFSPRELVAAVREVLGAPGASQLRAHQASS